MLPLFMVLSWIFTVSMNVKDIVYEKEKGLKVCLYKRKYFKFKLILKNRILIFNLYVWYTS